ncbi:MAG: sporulation peptidase YabG [Firmicutes bacterium]|nr:sporulation peptidase YabG [Bacillota bacterium]
MKIKCGDIVARLSHNKDLYFKVEAIDEQAGIAHLKGLEMRLLADAPLSDLEKPGAGELASYRAKALRLRLEVLNRSNKKRKRSGSRGQKKSVNEAEYVNLPGRVLHLDGDLEYLDICQRAYQDLNLPNCCFHVQEQKQPELVLDLMEACKPDILVLTGHDSVIRRAGKPDGPDSYRNSRHFIEAVRRARRFQSSKDDLVIFAGACQSWYQGLMEAGANFASSPDRILIHCLDPVMIVEKVAYTPIQKTIDIYTVLSESITGPPGIGGIETRGQYRIGLPKQKN